MLNLIGGSISSYYSIINSTEWIHMIKQENWLSSFLGHIQSDHLGLKEGRKKIDMVAEEYSMKKYEQNQIREDKQRLKGLDTCEILVRLVLAFGMDHIKNLKVKELRVIICYNFGSEILR